MTLIWNPNRKQENFTSMSKILQVRQSLRVRLLFYEMSEMSLSVLIIWIYGRVKAYRSDCLHFFLLFCYQNVEIFNPLKTC